MYEEFFKAIYNTVVVLGGGDDILSILDTGKDIPLEDLVRKLHTYNSEKMDELKGQVLKFKGIQVVNGKPIIKS